MTAKSDPTRPKAVLLDALRDLLPPPLRERPKSDYLAVVLRRVDPARCIESVRASPVRLPHLDYQRLFDDFRSDPRRVPIFLVVALTRLHEFARRAA